MLTIQINDSTLEKGIAERAKAVGKTVQDFITDLAAKELRITQKKENKLPFDIPRLDVREHARIIDYQLTEEEEELLAQNPDVKPFSHVTDSAKYVHDLRRKSRY